MSQLKNGAILSYLTIFLTNGIGLVLTPFIIRQLGNSEYGLYTLIGSMIAYISVLDFGLNNAIIRFVSKFRATNDAKSEENFIATSFLIYFFISLLITLVGIVLYFNLESIFDKLTPSELEKGKIMFAILIFNLAITLPGGAFAAISSAYEQFVFPRTLNIVKYLVRSIAVVVILICGSDAIGIVVLDTIVNIAVIGFNAFFVFRKLKVKIKLHHFEMALVKTIFSYSIWIFVNAIAGQFQWQAGQVILGMISGTKDIVVYGIGIMLGTYYGAFSFAISGVFLPRATKMIVDKASGFELTTMMIRIGRFSFLTLLLILGGFLLFGKQFVQLWVGNQYINSWYIALIIMICYTVPLLQAFANSILEARIKFYVKAIVNTSLIIIGTLFGAFLVRFYGVFGLIFGSTGGWIISQIIMNIYFHKVLDLNIIRFFKELFHKILPVFIMVIFVGFCINFIPGTNWINLGLKISLFFLVFVLLMFNFGLNTEEKITFKELFPAKFR